MGHEEYAKQEWQENPAALINSPEWMTHKKKSLVGLIRLVNYMKKSWFCFISTVFSDSNRNTDKKIQKLLKYMTDVPFLNKLNN